VNFKHPLNVSHFSWLDRLKICSFFLNPKNRWTQDKYVKQYEKAWENYTGAKHVVLVSSGSTANTLIAQYTKDREDFSKKIVVFPATTWQTSVSPWVREGFTPHFIDINLVDFSIDLGKLEEYLSKNHKKVNTVFVTSLIGFTPNIPKLKKICFKYNVSLKLDNCENSFGDYVDLDRTEFIDGEKYFVFKPYHICSQFTSSTSTYFGHMTVTGAEGGLIFTNDDAEYEYYLMNRAHGMVRNLAPYNIDPRWINLYRNKEVDPQFDFFSLGNNFRNTDIAAYIGLLDFKRIDKYINRRIELYKLFHFGLCPFRYYLPPLMGGRRGVPFFQKKDVPFCLPVIASRCFKINVIDKARKACEKLGVETRPIISGNLLRQTPYKKYGNSEEFPNAEFLHQNGFYVGLYPNLKEKQIIRLTNELNNCL